jgi:hypothetical protein
MPYMERIDRPTEFGRTSAAFLIAAPTAGCGKKSHAVITTAANSERKSLSPGAGENRQTFKVGDIGLDGS